jgi:hypothetical protein
VVLSSDSDFLLIDHALELLARTAEPGADRAIGDAECLRHFLVAEFAQGNEQDDVPLAPGQPGEGPCELRLQALGGHRADDTALESFRRRLGPDASQRHVVAGLLAPMPRHQVGRDAEQPGPQAPAAGVEPVALAERHQKRLGRDIVGCLHAQPAAHIAEDVADVPVVDDGEHLRVTLEQGGEFGIRHRVSHVGGHDSALVIQVPFRRESQCHPCFAAARNPFP